MHYSDCVLKDLPSWYLHTGMIILRLMQVWIMLTPGHLPFVLRNLWSKFQRKCNFISLKMLTMSFVPVC